MENVQPWAFMANPKMLASILTSISYIGIKLGIGGLVRAYSGVALECLKGAETHIVKPKVPIGMDVPFDLLGPIYHQLQHFHVEDIKQDYDTGRDDHRFDCIVSVIVDLKYERHGVVNEEEEEEEEEEQGK
ncbi:hypothetical protein HPP92_016155 [Vanilla planifolia]|uniref:Uncharacterized protein n=1 Tax=Vanilla planifolia TaxID=51239 RepID=A0A835UQ78_VANPL|nr:hypothetical protein HPP92_016155 [Vanilla planifolia]